jgi:hypothetical protein
MKVSLRNTLTPRDANKNTNAEGENKSHPRDGTLSDYVNSS